MNKIYSALFATLRSALFGESVNADLFSSFSNEDWAGLYKVAKEQGVGAIALDGISSNEIASAGIPKALKLKWISTAVSIEQRSLRQFNTASDFAQLMADNGIKTYVLKGAAVGEYYPNPDHRECGDLDCFLGSSYEDGNQIAEKGGASVNRDYYKHSHIQFNGLEIENHQFCTGIRGSKIAKEFESYLQQIISAHGARYIKDSKLIKPAPDFNALFLTTHAITHFLSEGIKLRHICDWALLLKEEQNNIDWGSFYEWSDRMHYTLFANTLTSIAVNHLGLPLINPQVRLDSRYADRILIDTLNSDGIFNKGHSPWQNRFLIIKNKLCSVWKYHKIYRKSVCEMVIRQALGFVFERKPHL